ncbi:pentapeptide repeat-containing protein [Oscillatoria sp. FACHB-1407]|uniref:pentapeptide repeat-containing protein n=1 Tax=Oscillatoria sp. FACHB-1407 TaxID=2692847 RepID=UPI0016884EAE|nr:pentapeptide repeat-containing protein [Oscillatoria sp. FACHB-1407]MBD2459798.1 pentapeptide repeat-containing protein [Oscillatoria sp. FACHB-1407]
MIKNYEIWGKLIIKLLCVVVWLTRQPFTLSKPIHARGSLNRKSSVEGSMRLITLAATFLLTLFCFITPAQAANPDHVKQLLEQRSCIGCDLSTADLRHKDLRGVNLSNANLSHADLSKADLMAVNFKDANLSGADLSDANLLVVNLTGANLENATLKNVNLNSATICNTIGPDKTLSKRDCVS